MRSPLPLLVGACLAVCALSPSNSFAGVGKQPLSPKNPVTIATPPMQHGFFVRGGGGVEFPLGGDFLQGAVACDPAAALGFPANLGNLNVNFGSVDWDDVYDEMYGGNIELGYDITRRLAAYVGLGYLSGDANVVNIGTINGRPAFAAFDDYEAWRLYAGLRHELGKGDRRLRPYVGAHAGVSFTDAIGADLSVPGLGRRGATAGSRIPIYDESEVFFGGFTFGLAYAMSDNFDIGVETGINYQGELDGNDTGLGTPNLASLNDGEGFWSIPVRLYGQLRF